MEVGLLKWVLLVVVASSLVIHTSEGSFTIPLGRQVNTDDVNARGTGLQTKDGLPIDKLETLVDEDNKWTADDKRIGLVTQSTEQQHQLIKQTAEPVLEALDNNNDNKHNNKPGLPDFMKVNYLEKMGEGIKGIIKPYADYATLIGRYHNWYAKYKKTYENYTKNKDKTPTRITGQLDPGALMRAEYIKVDRELHEQFRDKAQKLAQATGKELDMRPFETTDFLYEALKRLIDRLEVKLEELAESGSIEVVEELTEEDLNKLKEEELEANKKFEEAMDRVKRIAKSTVKGVVTRELTELSRRAILDGLATMLANHPAAADTLGPLVPLVRMLGTANAPLVASYLTNLKFRYIAGALDGWNPVPELGKKLFKIR